MNMLDGQRICFADPLRENVFSLSLGFVLLLVYCIVHYRSRQAKAFLDDTVPSGAVPSRSFSCSHSLEKTICLRSETNSLNMFVLHKFLFLSFFGSIWV